MRLTETAKLWGNSYRKRYYLDGARISESYASIVFDDHHHEEIGYERIQSGWRTSWNIGPRVKGNTE